MLWYSPCKHRSYQWSHQNTCTSHSTVPRPDWNRKSKTSLSIPPEDCQSTLIETSNLLNFFMVFCQNPHNSFIFLFTWCYRRPGLVPCIYPFMKQTGIVFICIHVYAWFDRESTEPYRRSNVKSKFGYRLKADLWLLIENNLNNHNDHIDCICLAAW